MNDQPPRLLLTAAELRDELRKPNSNILVFDCTVSMFPEESGYRIESVLTSVVKSRIPGAYYLDLRDGLHDATNDQGFARAIDTQLQEVLRASGISQNTHVVLYSNSHPMRATRVWWQLYAAGLRNVSILDGGLEGWQAIGNAVARGELDVPEAGDIVVDTDPRRWAEINEVAETMQMGGAVSICALPAASYSGTSDEHYGRPGHIPGSLNVPYDNVLRGRSFKNTDELRKAFETCGLRDDQRIVCYCGGGIAATVDAFVLTLLGYSDVAVYDGSMHEWSRDLSRPVATGEGP